MLSLVFASHSKLPIKLERASKLEFCVREAGPCICILAAEREGAAAQGHWFGPNEVHVYRAAKGE